MDSVAEKGIVGKCYWNLFGKYTMRALENRRCMHRLYSPNLKKGLVVIITWKPVGKKTVHASSLRGKCL